MPVVTQVANHLTRFGRFKSSDLILVYAGSNDAFIQFDTFAATAARIQAEAAAGTDHARPGEPGALPGAAGRHKPAMKTAALELATLSRRRSSPRAAPTSR